MNPYRLTVGWEFPQLLEHIKMKNISCSILYNPDGVGIIESVERELPFEELEQICEVYTKLRETKSSFKPMDIDLFDGSSQGVPKRISVHMITPGIPNGIATPQPHQINMKINKLKLVLCPFRGVNFYADAEITNLDAFTKVPKF